MNASVASDPMPKNMGRIPGLDGLRTFAVLLVMLLHVGLVGCGWIGVQVFFVLSGFLITRVLLDAKDDGTGFGPFFRTFYARRSLRIFPVYFLYLLAVITVMRATSPDEWSRIAPLVPYLLTYTYNFGQMIEPPAPSVWLGHLWSLSIEEQFYLVWPLLVFFASRGWLMLIAAGLVLAGPALRLVVYLIARDAGLYGSTPFAGVYIHPLSHVDAFATGALLCRPAIASRLSRMSTRSLLLSTAAFLALSMLWSGTAILPPGPNTRPLLLGLPATLPTNGQFLWGYSGINLLAAALIAKVAFAGSGHRLLCHPVIDLFGRVSYGAYLFHLGFISWFAGALTPPLTELGLPVLAAVLVWFPAYVLFIFGMAWISFRWLETPFLRLKSRDSAQKQRHTDGVSIDNRPCHQEARS